MSAKRDRSCKIQSSTIKRTLENFRFVLDHRLQQLSAERGPITQHIEGLEQHIRTINEEFIEEFQLKKEESMTMEKKDVRLATLTNEAKVLRHDNRTKDIYIATFRRELENVICSIGQKELELAVKQLYRKYVRGEGTDKEITPSQNGDGGNAVEFLLADASDDEVSVGSITRGGGKARLGMKEADDPVTNGSSRERYESARNYSRY